MMNLHTLFVTFVDDLGKELGLERVEEVK